MKCAAPRFLGMILPSLTLLGCPSGPAQMPANVPTAEALLAKLEARQKQVRTVRAEAKVEFWDNVQNDRIKGKLLMWIVRDGRLRIDVDSQLGPLSSLAVTGPTFQLLDVRADKYFT